LIAHSSKLNISNIFLIIVQKYGESSKLPNNQRNLTIYLVFRPFIRTFAA